MKTIDINVTQRRCTLADSVTLVCDNADYSINFHFDSEWDGVTTKTLRVSYNEKHEDVVFEGDSVTMPAVHDTHIAMIGVYSADMATAPVAIQCESSILSGVTTKVNTTQDMFEQLLAILNNLEAQSGTVESAMQNVRTELLAKVNSVETTCENTTNAAIATVNESLAENAYKAGDTVSITRGFLDGYTTSSQTSTYIRVPLAKSLANVSGVTCTSLNATLINAGGYGTSTSSSTSATEWTSYSGVTKFETSIIKETNCVIIHITTSAGLKLTNNTNIQCRLGTVSLTFS